MRRREFYCGPPWRGGLAIRPTARGGGAASRWRFANQPPQQSVRVARVSGGLATFGWVEGRNLRIDYRFAGDPSRLAEYAEELVNLRPDVIFAYTLAGLAQKAPSPSESTAPIDPVLVQSGSRSAIPPASPCSGSGPRFGTDDPCGNRPQWRVPRPISWKAAAVIAHETPIYPKAMINAMQASTCRILIGRHFEEMPHRR
jgi:hypothetical protein